MEQPDSKSVKLIPLEVKADGVKLSDVERALVASLALRAKARPLSDVIWYGPPGGNKGGAGGAGASGRPGRANQGGRTRMRLFGSR